MKDELLARRLVENEVLARTNNIKAGNAMDAMSTKIKAVFFYCECSRKACREQIPLSVAIYKKIHKDKNRFFVTPGHDTSSVESVEERHPSYWIVQKYDIEAA